MSLMIVKECYSNNMEYNQLIANETRKTLFVSQLSNSL